MNVIPKRTGPLLLRMDWTPHPRAHPRHSWRAGGPMPGRYPKRPACRNSRKEMHSMHTWSRRLIDSPSLPSQYSRDTQAGWVLLRRANPSRLEQSSPFAPLPSSLGRSTSACGLPATSSTPMGDWRRAHRSGHTGARHIRAVAVSEARRRSVMLPTTRPGYTTTELKGIPSGHFGASSFKRELMSCTSSDGVTGPVDLKRTMPRRSMKKVSGTPETP